MPFTVVGAGLAGLFAAAVLQQDCELVIEKQDAIPNNHSAVLRFRTGVFGEAVNIPFKKVPVIKSYIPAVGNPVGDSIAYSLKTNGSATLRSSITADGKVVERFIAPEDLVNRLAQRVGPKIQFSTEADFWVHKKAGLHHEPVISTIPMPVLMTLLGWDTTSEFHTQSGVNIRAKIPNCNVYATLYIPDPRDACYRVSITGDEFIAEYTERGYEKVETAGMEVDRLLWHFGLRQVVHGTIEVKRQKYAKILPIDERERKRFMLWATEQHNIYSFGRYATWRPDLQLDDLVKDLHVIQRMYHGTGYERKLNARS
jgi:hypothetical protein